MHKVTPPHSKAAPQCMLQLTPDHQINVICGLSFKINLPLFGGVHLISKLSDIIYFVPLA